MIIPITNISKPSTISNDLINVQTIFTNTSFVNFTLSHGIPLIFLKNEIFPFKGFLSVPNPNGLKINVIFTRVTDQKRLAFNQFLPANVTKFHVLTYLNLTGNYYLSIFLGQSGITNYKQYQIAPSFIGKIVSRSPNPLLEANLTLRGNDLYIFW